MTEVTTDPFVRAEHALTDDERELFLKRFTERNPRWQGANVSDILAELTNADANMAIKDRFCEELGALTLTESIAVDVLLTIGPGDLEFWSVGESVRWLTTQKVVELANRLAVVSDGT